MLNKRVVKLIFSRPFPSQYVTSKYALKRADITLGLGRRDLVVEVQLNRKFDSRREEVNIKKGSDATQDLALYINSYQNKLSIGLKFCILLQNPTDENC